MHVRLSIHSEATELQPNSGAGMTALGGFAVGVGMGWGGGWGWGWAEGGN